jgi:hypothetical protein
MKRYFYTDTLAAAWMAKHHGFVFEGTFVLDIEIARGKGLDERNSWFDGKAMIQPKCYHLLDPIEGDHLQVIGGHYHGSVVQTEVPKEMMSRWTGDPSLQPENYCGYKIIQRNGIAFMWPDAEE